MDIFNNSGHQVTLHLAPAVRAFPSDMPLRSLGYLPQKESRIQRTFESLNFSFILSGQGRYRWKNRWLKVKAPCVILQMPDVTMDYEPEPVWEELFFIFPPEAYDHLRSTGFIHPRKPMWPLVTGPRFQELLDELQRLMQDRGGALDADRIDRIAQLIILESRRGPDPQTTSEEEMKMHDLARNLMLDPGQDVDWDEQARQAGMHAATFRRYWSRAGYPPPARYLTDLRMQKACRLLIETPNLIGDIANAVGFDDPLHFSRRFKQSTKLSPRQYRQQNRIQQ